MPDPGSSRGISTRNTWPRGVGRGRRPFDLASISAAVLLAADRANASSSSLDDCDQVVRLTQPSSRPVDASRTGTAAQVNVHRLMRVVLVGADQRRGAVGQRQTQPVGADVAFGVGEARREVHVVEGLQQAVVAAHPAEHDAVGVGQHQADRFVGQRAVQVEEHLVAALGEQRFRGRRCR